MATKTVSDIVIDVSHWQTVNNWAEVKASGIAAVTLKASQGLSYVDPTFARRVKGAMDAGLLISAYHFLDATSPLQQMKHFWMVAGGLPKLFVDIEPNVIAGGTVSIMGAATAVSDLASMSGVIPGAYIGRYGVDGKGGGLPNVVLSRCELWVPGYTSTPVLPKGWSTWRMWQYTATGRVPGIEGDVDRSYFAGSAEELVQWWGACRPMETAQ